MTAITTVRIVPAPKAYAFKGKGKDIRTTALAGVASLAYAEGSSRAETITRLCMVLGKTPSDADVTATRAEYITGRVAQKLGAADLPSPDMDVPARIVFARSIVLQYAAPLKDGVKASKLKRCYAGRRTISQHKAVRAAEEAWSQLKADIGLGAAQTQTERNAKKRAPRMAGASKGAPSHSELVAGDGPMTADKARKYVDDMARTLDQFCKKHAALIDTARAQATTRYAGAMIQIAKDAKATKGAIA